MERLYRKISLGRSEHEAKTEFEMAAQMQSSPNLFALAAIPGSINST